MSDEMASGRGGISSDRRTSITAAEPAPAAELSAHWNAAEARAAQQAAAVARFAAAAARASPQAVAVQLAAGSAARLVSGGASPAADRAPGVQAVSAELPGADRQAETAAPAAGWERGALCYATVRADSVDLEADCARPAAPVPELQARPAGARPEQELARDAAGSPELAPAAELAPEALQAAPARAAAHAVAAGPPPVVQPVVPAGRAVVPAVERSQAPAGLSASSSRSAAGP